MKHTRKQLEHDLNAPEVTGRQFEYGRDGRLELVLEVRLSAIGRRRAPREPGFEPLSQHLIEVLEHVANADYPEAPRRLASALLFFEAGMSGREVAAMLDQSEADFGNCRQRVRHGGLLFLLRFRRRRRRVRKQVESVDISRADD